MTKEEVIEMVDTPITRDDGIVLGVYNILLPELVKYIRDSHYDKDKYSFKILGRNIDEYKTLTDNHGDKVPNPVFPRNFLHDVKTDILRAKLINKYAISIVDLSEETIGLLCNDPELEPLFLGILPEESNYNMDYIKYTMKMNGKNDILLALFDANFKNDMIKFSGYYPKIKIFKSKIRSFISHLSTKSFRDSLFHKNSIKMMKEDGLNFVRSCDLSSYLSKVPLWDEENDIKKGYLVVDDMFLSVKNLLDIDEEEEEESDDSEIINEETNVSEVEDPFTEENIESSEILDEEPEENEVDPDETNNEEVE